VEERVLVMLVEIYISSIVLAAGLLSLLAWKWFVKFRISVPGGIVIGVLTALIVSYINSASGLNSMGALIPIELALIFVIASLAVLIKFYRNPERHPPETENVILSPADGRVIYVNGVDKDSDLISTKGERKYKLGEIIATDMFTDAAYLVGIDMNVLNVHVNRSPIAGKTVLCHRTRGRFVSLRRQDSEVLNERVTTVIVNGNIRIGVVQIASRLVRKIVSYIKEGDDLNIGQRIGSIIFGSQVDVVIPGLDNLKIEVKPGDEVKAGVSVIAHYG
jgi:phosphatidylserine decarboxylase